MNLISTLAPGELADRLSLADHLESDPDKTTPSPWGLSRFIRREVRRNGLVTRRELKKCIEPYFVACGFDVDARKAINTLATQMVAVGELAELKVENQIGYSALPSRWIRFSDSDAVLLGTVGTESHRFDCFHPKQFLRRFRPTDKIIAEMQAIGANEQSFQEWFGEPGWKHLTDHKGGVESLDQLLEFHIARLDQEGSPLSLSDTRVLAIAHRPGDFFGQPWGSNATRWTTLQLMEDGVYVGAQPGFTGRQWHPLLLRIDGQTARSIPLHVNNVLHSSNELRAWLLIALGKRKGLRERIDIAEEVTITFQSPQQLRRCLSLFGETSDGWSFSVLDTGSTQNLLSSVFPDVECRVT